MRPSSASLSVASRTAASEPPCRTQCACASSMLCVATYGGMVNSRTRDIDGGGDGAGGDGAGGNGAGGDGAADRWIGRGGAVVPGATFLARSLPEASSVQLAEGVSLPLRLADGDAGLVLVVPLTGQRFRVAGRAPLPHRQTPSTIAPLCTPAAATNAATDAAAAEPNTAAGSTVAATSAAGAILQPAVAAVDADGAIEWIGVAIVGECEALLHCADGGSGAGHCDEFTVPAATLRAHLRVLRAPAACFAWLPVEDAEGYVLLEEVDQGEEQAESVAEVGAKSVRMARGVPQSAPPAATKRGGASRARKKKKAGAKKRR
mmetsp:Transcript_23519/g.69034  ORF Transcript_23519/g.69034 Transcript_23519/m.69034 type:complete len:319 (-) Transcript_23519:65-1021(-)